MVADSPFVGSPFTALHLTAPVLAFAQAPAKPAPRPTPRLPDGKPNLGLTPNASGYWGGGDGPLVQGANFPLKEIPFQPWAKGLYDYRNETLAKDDPYPKCVPHGGPRQFAAASPPESPSRLTIMGTDRLVVGTLLENVTPGS